MAVDKIDVADDERISHQYAELNGRKYHYLLAEPKNSPPKATCFLIHGWPDLSMAWRYQIPVLLQMGIRVVCPDMMGYGRTDAPKVTPEDMSLYGFKRAADDIAELARQLGVSKIILGGHDWGGAIVYRAAMWHANLVSHVFSVCTPYFPPSREYISHEDVVKKLPNFGYQLHLAGPEVEGAIKTREQIRAFLNAVYGGRGPNGEVFFSPEKGVLLENLSKVGKSPLLNDKEMDYYVEEFCRNGMHGTLNWYRNRKVNFDDELNIPSSEITCPVLFIQANKDVVLQPFMSKGMEKHIPNLTRREVDATHWALWQTPETVNTFLKEWIEGTVFGKNSKL